MLEIRTVEGTIHSMYTLPVPTRLWYACNSGGAIRRIPSRSSIYRNEISHFDVVAGTDDIAYGPEPCRKLAIDNPSDAINNADNYRFFAINDPLLSITNSLLDFTSRICVYKPFSVKANLMPILRISEKDNTSLRTIMSTPLVDLPI